MVSFFRVFQHLLPDSIAWRPKDKFTEWEVGDEHEIGESGLVISGEFGVGLKLWRFIKGLAGFPDQPRKFVDDVFQDLFPDTTRELAEWEAEFGLEPIGSESARRQALAAEWRATGGQSLPYLEGVLRTAGFNVWFHECWQSTSPFVARDPRAYTNLPLIGTYQCTGTDQDEPQCSPSGIDANGVAFDQPQCNEFLVNEPDYIVNLDLTPRAQAPVPDDPATWPFFIYVGGETFPARAQVSVSQRGAFERLLTKLCPEHHWIVTLIDYV